MRQLALALIFIALPVVAGCGEGGDEEKHGDADLRGRTFVSTKDWSGDGSAFSRPVTVDFKSDGGLSWQADCNTAGADVEITADRLMLGEIASTAIGCPGQESEQDQDLSAFFESNPRWQLEGNRLTLSSDSVEVALQANGR